MPTARELLEQADALMRRRNLQPVAAPQGPDAAEPTQGPATDSRFGATDAPAADPRVEPRLPSSLAYEGPPAASAGAAPSPSAAAALSAMRWSAPAPAVPVPTSSPVFAPPPSRSPRTIQREPIAPSVARTALPVDPGEPPAPAVPYGAAAQAAEADFPLLTDAVEDDELARLQGRDDVPLLTEAVDAAVDEPILEDLDEPSVWTPTFGAALTVGRPAPAGAAAEVPSQPAAEAGSAPAPLADVLPDAARDPLGLDRPAPGFEPPRTAQWSEPEAPDGGASDAAPRDEPAAEVPFREEAPADVVARGDATARAPDADELPAGEQSAEAFADERAAPPLAAAEAHDEPPAIAVAEREAAAEHVEAPATADTEVRATAPDWTERSPPEVAVVPATGALAPLDDARVREIAEEIGMQVLQRIDIFTDTELRARLGERLKPVVDRASADLVAAINQQVGELLRAFVAEAIEKEIDRWREGRS